MVPRSSHIPGLVRNCGEGLRLWGQVLGSSPRWLDDGFGAGNSHRIWGPRFVHTSGECRAPGFPSAGRSPDLDGRNSRILAHGDLERSPKNTYIRSPKNDRIFQVFWARQVATGPRRACRSWGIRGPGKITWKLGGQDSWNPGFLERVPKPGMSEGEGPCGGVPLVVPHMVASQETSVCGDLRGSLRLDHSSVILCCILSNTGSGGLLKLAI